MKLLLGLAVLGILVVIVVFALAALGAFLGRHGAKRTRDEFIKDLEQIADDTADHHLIDSFECVKLRDPKLEAIRLEVLDVLWSSTTSYVSPQAAEAMGILSTEEVLTRIKAILERVKREG